jgi:crossover junction endodeoxyribonuclease RuvC
MKGSTAMIVMGIDPGIARVGYGVIRQEKGEGTTPVAYGCIRTDKDTPAAKRLLAIYTDLDQLFTKYRPDSVAIEKLFFTRNITSAMSVAEVRGVIRLLAEQRQIPVTEYTPNQVKQAITGSGRADKRQMQTMIQRLLGLSTLPSPDDAADGLSIALCHIHVLR